MLPVDSLSLFPPPCQQSLGKVHFLPPSQHGETSVTSWADSPWGTEEVKSSVNSHLWKMSNSQWGQILFKVSIYKKVALIHIRDMTISSSQQIMESQGSETSCQIFIPAICVLNWVAFYLVCSLTLAPLMMRSLSALQGTEFITAFPIRTFLAVLKC